jgi:hypothetical protein
MNARTPAPANGGGRSAFLALVAMFLGAMAAIVAIVIVARRDAGAVRPGDPLAQVIASTGAAQESPVSIEEVTLVLERHRDRLMRLPGVIGLYVGADHRSNLVLRVLLLHGFESTRAQIPAVLDGVPVDVEASDPIRPL